jgi:hypothetical protein
MAEWSGPQLPTSRTERTGMIKRLVVREVRDCWQAALLLVPPEQVLVPPQVPAQVLHRLGNLSERLLLGV